MWWRRRRDSFLSRHDMRKGAMALIDAEAAERLYAAMPPGEESSGGSAANTCAVAAGAGRARRLLGQGRRRRAGRRVPPRHRRRRRAFPDRAAARGRAHRALPDRGDAGRAAHHEHLSRRLRGVRRAATWMRRWSPQSAVLYLEGYLFDPPAAQAAFRRAAAAAHAAGRQVALSLSDPFCVDRHRERLPRPGPRARSTSCSPTRRRSAASTR